MNKQSSYRNRGFTLIELLVVIAIIAILAAILFPVFAKAREAARQAACQSNCKQIGIGLMMYAQDFDEILPRAWTANGGPNNAARDWATDTVPYIKNTAVFVCPSKPTQSRGYGYNTWLATSTGRPLAAIDDVSRTCMFNEIVAAVDRSWPWNYSTADRRFEPEARHNDGMVMGFCDGHVKWLNKNKNGLIAPATNNLTGTWWLPTATSP